MFNKFGFFTVAFAAGILWTGLVFSLYLVSIEVEKNSILRQAQAEAQTAHDKDLTYRRWATRMGGLYVEESETMQPNPYLKVPNRDVETTSGQRLTLVNPAYMARMVYEMMAKEAGLQAHITSLTPIRPGNAPLPWEIEALESFENGETEFTDLVTLSEGHRELRYMLPMVVEKGCLKCHGYQNYNIGDVRGGISVTVPMDKYDAALAAYKVQSMQQYAAMWIVGGLFVCFHFFLQYRKTNQLHASQAQYRALFGSVMDPILVSEAGSGIITECNDIAGAVFGLPREDLVGSRLQDLYAEGGAVSEPGLTDDVPIRCAGGEERLMSIHAGRLDLNGQEYLISLFRDTTDRKRTEEQMLVAKQAAERANTAKSVFLANMSHEIRTPLNGIIGMLQLLQLTPVSEEQQDYIDSASESSLRLTSLLSDILDLTRVEGNVLSVNDEPFDLHQCLRHATGLFQLTARQTGLELRCEIDPAVPEYVVGDSARLQQIFNNLLGNAIKFTPSGSVTLAVHPLSGAEAGSCRLLFSVADTGIGIPEDKLGNLFQPFTQVSEGYRRNYQGAGLGLSICKRLAQLMGGNMAVESDIGVGTTMYMTLTLPVAPAPPEEEEEPFLEPDCREGLRILFAEDDRINQVATVRLAERMGHAVTAVDNGQAALAALRDGEFDMILMDVQMPIMDGVEATQRIRNGEAGADKANIPIIAMTAYTMSGDSNKLLSSGMNGYLAKPVELQSFRNELSRVAGACFSSDT